MPRASTSDREERAYGESDVNSREERAKGESNVVVRNDVKSSLE